MNTYPNRPEDVPEEESNQKEAEFSSQEEVENEAPKSPKSDSGWKKVVALLGVIILVAGLAWWFTSRSDESGEDKLIDVNKGNEMGKQEPINQGDVSPISGLACENWNRRPVAVMQPSDSQARPPAGMSEADMVVEMPVLTTGFTRLMAVYVCGTPPEVGSMRSARPDFVHLAKGMDAIFTHWGRAELDSFVGNLNDGVIDNLNCNNDAGQSARECCFRKEGMSRGVDSGYAKFDELLKCAEEFGYRTENRFGGYPHQQEAPIEQRPEKANLEVGYPGDLKVIYDYDQENNEYVRYWGGVKHTDRNNEEVVAAKNIVVLIAKDNNMEEDPHYNNMELGDPWYDQTESGEAYFYMNGKEIKGRWSKDSSKVDSKLMLMDENGREIKFVPGQIWLNVVYPNMKLDWDEGKTAEEELSAA
ncbi:MAG: DUF3048 domain-containing protein [Candidatus Moranbacteria bacterium]|nr:DUF3048 domain-containing protein [Candidatus Moranbacteria bacterium]